jgi:hypothetical protein
LFITVIETCGLSFSVKINFSRWTRAQHSKVDHFGVHAGSQSAINYFPPNFVHFHFKTGVCKVELLKGASLG